jgi:uncharacterized protein (TIGR03067 family)
MTACSIDGKPLPEEYVKQGKRLAKGNDLKVTVSGQTMLRGRFRVDRKTEPKSIDYLVSGRIQRGIYKLDKGALETIFGATRPKNFSPVPGTTWSIWKKL